MVFRFQLIEPFDAGFRRLMLEQIERAEQELSSTGDRAVAVHEMRKSMKRCRALLRMVRPAIGGNIFHGENARFRSAAHHLGGARDQHVIMETLAKLEAADDGANAPMFVKARKAIADRGDTGVTPGAIAETLKLLEEGREALQGIEFGGETGFAMVREGLEETYRRGRKAFRTAYDHATDEHVHEWRKTVQQHWRQMAALEVSWPDTMKARAGMARRLSQLLGDDHDLAVLIAFASGHLDTKTARGLIASARAAQARIRVEAQPLGSQLYYEKPKALGARIAHYWHSAERFALMEARAAGEAQKGPGKVASDKSGDGKAVDAKTGRGKRAAGKTGRSKTGGGKTGGKGGKRRSAGDAVKAK